eukprot:TRINITY_DN23915_c0_g1_i1.p1 TRINITY_DN23915_c0_g1~~TRINITY_DN23915_c0_g1_i1.p1  ORF type:complete len:361 (+),score=34.95 TRINITY_DN23915_c0_g1_i1:73-1083(+)
MLSRLARPSLQKVQFLRGQARLVAQWSPVEAASTPAPRSSHTVTALGSDRVAVFGGEDGPRSPFDPRVHILDGTGTWSSLPEAAPSQKFPVLGHGAAAVGDKLYLFGGRYCSNPADPEGFADAESGELMVCDTRSGAWKQCDQAEAPEPRSYHCMTSLGDSLYVFGGCGAAGRGRLNDLWKYDTGTGKWSCLSPGGDDCPRGRGGSSLLSLQGTGGAPDQLVLTYGFCGEQVADVHMFDLRSGSWNDLSAEQTGDLPGPRSVFATALIPGGRMILVGGEQEESALGHAGAGKFAGDCYLLELPSSRPADKHITLHQCCDLFGIRFLGACSALWPAD